MSIQVLPDGLVKDVLEIPLRECRALHIFVCLDLLRNRHSLLILDRSHLLLTQTFFGRIIVSQIKLRTDKNDRDIWCVVVDFRIPL